MQGNLFLIVGLEGLSPVQSPLERPSAENLLQSDLIPVPFPVSHLIKEALRPRIYPHLLSALFSHSSPAMKVTDLYNSDPTQSSNFTTKGTKPIAIFSYCAISILSILAPSSGWHYPKLEASIICQHLALTFRRHGAVPRNSGHIHDLIPPLADGSFDSPILMLHRGGSLVHLRTEMRSAFLRSQKVRGVEKSRTFEIGTVFRQNSNGNKPIF